MNARALLGIAAITMAFAVIFGVGPVNYDSAYALVWGGELASGGIPDLRADLAPTNKPLLTVVGLLVSPLGHAGLIAMAVLALVFLGLLAAATAAVGDAVAGRWAGVIAAALLLTREPVLSFGLRAYSDVAYCALVLAALAIELRRPRAGTPVLVLLAATGLLRPEAWLFSFAYVAWTYRDSREMALIHVALAAAAPVLWIVGDWGLTGDPLWSLMGTRDTGQQLNRPTGVDALVTLAPRRIAEIVREPVLIAAFAGAWLLLVRRTREDRTLLVAAAVAVLAFALLAVAGLPALGRYLLLDAALVVVVASVGLSHWGAAESSKAALGVRRGVLAVAILSLVVLAPGQAQRLTRLDSTLTGQRDVLNDLHALADEVPSPRCRPVAAPTHRPVPQLALWLDMDPASISVDIDRSGTAFVTTSPRATRLILLDRRDPVRRDIRRPAGEHPVKTSRYWALYVRC